MTLHQRALCSLSLSVIVPLFSLILMGTVIEAKGETTQESQDQPVSASSGSLLPSPFYVSIFGGAGAFFTNSMSQTGTALYGASKGGPLAVNANGSGTSNAFGMGGINLGYKWSAWSQKDSQWSFVPAAELEGYYLQGTQNGTLTNETDRLDLHQFAVTYPMHTGVLLANAVLTANYAESKIHPYLGLGLGAAIVSIQGADSTQTAPEEPGINHYNSDNNASDWAFAAQSKLGLLYNLNAKTSVFVEYRFLYLAPTSYTFGSTVYPTHTATTDWNVDIGSMYYNMGTIGIRYDA